MGRKCWLAIFLIIIGTIFGVYCVERGVDLVSGGLYWGAITSGVVGYFFANVKQKLNGN